MIGSKNSKVYQQINVWKTKNSKNERSSSSTKNQYSECFWKMRLTNMIAIKVGARVCLVCWWSAVCVCVLLFAVCSLSHVVCCAFVLLFCCLVLCLLVVLDSFLLSFGVVFKILALDFLVHRNCLITRQVSGKFHDWNIFRKFDVRTTQFFCKRNDSSTTHKQTEEGSTNQQERRTQTAPPERERVLSSTTHKAEEGIEYHETLSSVASSASPIHLANTHWARCQISARDANRSRTGACLRKCPRGFHRSQRALVDHPAATEHDITKQCPASPPLLHARVVGPPRNKQMSKFKRDLSRWRTGAFLRDCSGSSTARYVHSSATRSNGHEFVRHWPVLPLPCRNLWVVQRVFFLD